MFFQPLDMPKESRQGDVIRLNMDPMPDAERAAVTFRLGLFLAPADYPAAGLTAENFPGYVAESFTSALGGQSLPWLDEPKRKDLRDSLERFVKEHEPQAMTDDLRREIVLGVRDYVQTRFAAPRAGDTFAQEAAYCSFPDGIQTFQWCLWQAMQRAPLGPDAAARRESQREWLRAHVASLPEQAPTYTHSAVLKQLEARFNDPFCPLFYQPMTEAQFEEFKRCLKAHAPTSELLYVVPHAVWQAMLAQYPDWAKVVLPFQDRVNTAGQGNGYIQMAFDSNRWFAGRQLPLGAGGFLDVCLPAILTEKERSNLAPARSGDVKFEVAGGARSLVAVRGATIIHLQGADWMEIDAIPDGILQTPSAWKEMSSFSLEGLKGLSETNLQKYPGRFVAVRTAEGRLSVLEVRSIDQDSVNLHVRARMPAPAAAADAVPLAEMPGLPVRTYDLPPDLATFYPPSMVNPWPTNTEEPQASRIEPVLPAAAETPAQKAFRRQIEEQVKTSEPWESAGGRAAMQFKEQGSRFIVRQTPEGHEQIAKLLANRLEKVTAMIQMQCRFIGSDMADTKALSQWLTQELNRKAVDRPDRLEDSYSLSKAQATAFLAEIQKRPATQMLAAPRLTLFSGAPAYVCIGQRCPALLPHVGKPLEERVELTLGTTLGARAVISDDKRSIRISLRPQVTESLWDTEPKYSGQGPMPVLMADAEITLDVPAGGAVLIPVPLYPSRVTGFRDSTEEERPWSQFQPVSERTQKEPAKVEWLLVQPEITPIEKSAADAPKSAAIVLPAETPWGDAVEGVQTRLRADKVQWKAGEAPTLTAAVRNTGTRSFTVQLDADVWDVEFDGQWYNYIGPLSRRDRIRPLLPSNEQGDVHFTLFGPAWARKGSNNTLALTPGKHTVRVAAQPKPTEPAGAAAIRVVSNPVEIEILPSEAKVAEPPWGEAVEGVQTRLRADKVQWKAGEMPTFKADIRNTGKDDLTTAQSQVLWELQVDGQWYTWSGDIAVKSSALPPGREYHDIGFTLEATWHRRDGQAPLALAPGKHTVSVAAHIAHADDAKKGPVICPISNAVEIEILPAEAKAATPAAAGADKAKIEHLIEQLASDKFEEREAAQKALSKTGAPAVAALQVAASDKDPERAHGAAAALKEIEENAFGGQKDGFQIRLRPLQSQWKADETVSLQLQLCNRGPKEIGCPGFKTPSADCRVELDGQWYGCSLPISINVPDSLLEPGEVLALGVDLVDSWVAKEEGKAPKPLKLVPGIHLVRISYTDVISNYVQVEVQAKSATSAAALAAKAAEPPWGAAVEGVEVRLAAGKVQWKAGETPVLAAEIRNQGKRNLYVIRTSRGSAEMELDGQWYHGTVTQLTSPSDFVPGTRYEDIEFRLDEFWESRPARAPLKITPGKHSVRVAMTAESFKVGEPPVRAVSNPVEIEILPAEAKAALAAATEAAEPVAGEEMVLSVHDGKVRVVVDGREVSMPGGSFFLRDRNGKIVQDSFEVLGDQVRLTERGEGRGSSFGSIRVVVNLHTGEAAAEGGIVPALLNLLAMPKPPAEAKPARTGPRRA